MILEESLFLIVVINLRILIYSASNSSSIDGKIINGTDVDAVNIKYMASITQHFPNINRYYHFCAGFLITQRHILTTYICIVQIYENGGTFLQNIAVFLGVSEVK